MSEVTSSVPGPDNAGSVPPVEAGFKPSPGMAYPIKRGRGRPRKMQIRSVICEGLANHIAFKSIDPESPEVIQGLREILSGKYLREAEKYVTRDLVICELVKLAFAEGVPINYKMGALTTIIHMLGYDREIRKREVPVPVMLDEWSKEPTEEVRAEAERRKRDEALLRVQAGGE